MSAFKVARSRSLVSGLVGSCILSSAFFVCSSTAALFQTVDWAAIGTLGGSVGYDSNLSLNNNGEGDGFITVEPGIVIKRRNSLTRLEFNANLVGTDFFSGRPQAQIDGSAGLEFAYPESEGSIPQYTGYARYQSSKVGDPTLGQRVTLRTTSANFSGRIFSTGKVGMIAGVSYDRLDYGASGYNVNDRGSLTLGVAYELSPLTEYSLNLISSIGSSVPSAVGGMHVNSYEEALTAKVRVDIASKLTGSIFAGLELAKYRGDFHRSEVLPIAGGELTWQLTPRGSLSTTLMLGADFSPDGETSESEGITVAYHQIIYGAWNWNASVQPMRVTYHRETRTREDNVAVLGTGIAYQPTIRLSFYLEYSYRRQSSTLADADFNRHLFLLRAVNRF